MKRILVLLVIVLPFILWISPAFSAQGQRGTLNDESIAYTKHNLSSYWPSGAGADIRTVKSATTTEMCVFCHTPHGSNVEDLGGGVKAPLWNKRLSTTSGYFLYDEVWSPTLEAYTVNTKPSAPTGYSKLCLSCHDGTLALGNVFNAPGSGGYSPTGGSSISLSGTATGTEGGTVTGGMPAGSGAYTGDTRLIGKNLSNDHPISFVFDTNLYDTDKEIVTPSSVVDPVTNKTLLYSGTTSTRNSVQCTSCHNPHTTYEKFLRMSKWQTGSGNTQKQICLFCHSKPGWTGSTHQTSTKTFNSSGLPSSDVGFAGKQMTEVGCLACHDTHTIQGAERLLRDAVDSATYTAKGNTTAGDKSKSAIENLCYRCHSRSSASLSTPHGLMDNNATPPPDIWTQFNKTSSMPISDSSSQGNHQPIFTMSQPTDASIPTSYDPKTDYEKVLVGITGTISSQYKHVECTDCHNPHRVRSSGSTSLNGIDRLAGMRGIRVDGTVMQSVNNANTSGTYRSMVEIPEACFRCHGDTYNTFIPTKYDNYLRRQTGGTVVNESQPTRTTAGDPASNNTHGSNKRLEFNPNASNANTPGLNNSAFHPVTTTGKNQTGVFDSANSTRFGLWTNSGLSRSKTINCTDCHNNDALGAGTFSGTSASPSFAGSITQSTLRSYTESGRTLSDVNPSTTHNFNNLSSAQAKGPHGSSNNRILRSNYNTTLAAAGSLTSTNTAGDPPFTGFNANNFALCFNCHNIEAFTDTSSIRTNFRMTGFMCAGNLNLHAVHLNNGGGGGMMGAWDVINMYTACANCHYNVHSNIEAANTIYGDGNGGLLPNHGGTRLVNFSPIIQPNSYSRPRWWYDGTDMRCDMRCHNNVIMSGAGGGGMGGMGGMGGGMGGAGGGIEAVYTYFGN